MTEPYECTLRELLDRVKRGLKEEEIAAMCYQGLCGLKHFQKYSVIMGMIKASKMVITAEGKVKIGAWLLCSDACCDRGCGSL